jgi:hypothetical protein
MLIQRRTVRWVLAGVVFLLLIPLIAMLGMMLMGGAMITQMGMSTGDMALCGLWSVLVAAALILLLTLLIRGTGGADRESIGPAATRSPLLY